MTTFCAYPACGHSSEAHPHNGPCVIESCPCYAMVNPPEPPRHQKVTKPKTDFSSLRLCYICGLHPGVTPERCPHFHAAKKI